MQLNKVLKGLMIALPVMAIAHVLPTRTPAMTAAKACWVPDWYGCERRQRQHVFRRAGSSQMQQLQQNNIVYFDLDKYDIVLTSLKCWMHMQTSCVATRLQSHRRRSRGRTWYSGIQHLLGERRANAVKMYLQGKGVSATRSPSFLTVKKNLQYWVMTSGILQKPSCGTGLLRELHEQNFRHQLLSLSLLVGIAAPWALLLRHQSVVSAQARSKTASPT